MIGVGVVGFGLAGKVFHVPFIQAVSGLRLVAVARQSGEGDPKYPDIRFVRGVEALLAMDDVRVVVVATPNEFHAPIARQCLLAGRDVVIDKPFACTLAEAEQLATLARENKRLLTVFQNRRWDGDFQTVRQVINGGSLGRILYYESHFDRFRPALRGTWHERPQPGMGILFDLGPHLVDQALVLFGKPEAMTADVRKERDGSVVDDAFDITFHYPHMRALLRATAVAAAPGPRFWIRGTAGTLTKYGLDPQEDAMRLGTSSLSSPDWGSDPEANWGKLTTADRVQTVPTIPGDYRPYYENLRDALLGQAEIAVTAEQALDVMRALEIAVESSRQQRTLPWRS